MEFCHSCGNQRDISVRRCNLLEFILFLTMSETNSGNFLGRKLFRLIVFSTEFFEERQGLGAGGRQHPRGPSGGLKKKRRRRRTRGGGFGLGAGSPPPGPSGCL